MKLEWDEHKRQATLAERGLDFADCAEIFAGPRVVKDDTRKEYGEHRQIMLGPLRGQIIAVIFTRRGDRYRIISMRYANEKERRFFESKLGA
ncbi:MAG TPA: BrnT family toxin [Syntrophobacteraceae bacterium]|nr:BrnT family toxin [Syntrophobacteraceae bacterium]